jgi:hypothetical protein
MPIRIFPNARREFQTQGALASWLMNGLKSRGGKYLITSESEHSANRPAELPTGSVVLFRFKDLLLGEAIVHDYSNKPGQDEDDNVQYIARVFFVPSSIRMFSPPIPIEALQVLVGKSKDVTRGNPYYEFTDWELYPQLLAAHVQGEIRGQGGVLWRRAWPHDRVGAFL